MSKRIRPEVVTVIRKGHPDGEVRVNREDMLKDDVIKGQEDLAPNTESSSKEGEPKEGTKDWIIQELTKAGVKFDVSTKKSELKKQLEDLQAD